MSVQAEHAVKTDKKEYLRRYYRANLDRIKVANRKWYKRNRRAMLKYYRQYYYEHRDHLRRIGNDWAVKNRSKLLSYHRDYYKKNKSRMSKANAIWASKNRKNLRIYHRKYAEENRERLRKISRNWVRNNPEKASENRKKWWKKHPEYRIEASSKRRALKRNATIKPDKIKEWIRSVLSQDYVTCCYCKKEISTKWIHFDHIVPLARGGAHSLDNLCISCPPCNRSKGSKLVEEWLARNN